MVVSLELLGATGLRRASLPAATTIPAKYESPCILFLTFINLTIYYRDASLTLLKLASITQPAIVHLALKAAVLLNV